MGLEQRNGNFYYYEKRREGSHVVSEYAGSGLVALLAEECARERAATEAAERRAFEQRHAEIAAISAEIDSILAMIEAFAEAVMVAAGYHKHKRQWRKRRDG